MPELPEVEIMTRNAQRWAAGARVESVEILDASVLRGPTFVLDGQCLVGVVRRAKYMLMCFDSGRLAWHFRMTGKVVRGADNRRARLVMSFDNGEVLRFLDTRRFGTVEWVPAADAARWDAEHLPAPEPWPEPRDGVWWRDVLGRARGPIKVAMLDGKRVAGIGNIAASEILWRARVNPRREVIALLNQECSELAEAAHNYLTERVESDASDEIDYVNERGPNPFDVYGREGEPCRRCAATVARSVQAARSTYWCPACQGGRPL